MKKYSILMGAAFGMLALASCQKEVEINVPENEGNRHIPFELKADVPETKTTYKADTWEMAWEDGDILYAVTTDEEWGAAYVSSEETNIETIAEFTYSDSKFETTDEISEGKHTFNFLYTANYTQKTYHRGKSTSFSLLSAQSEDAAKPTAALKKNDALVGQVTATTPTTFVNVPMNHLFTLMKVTLKNKTGEELTVNRFEISAEDATLAGIFNVTFGETPSISLKSGGKSTIVVEITNGLIVNGGELPVYFVMAPLDNYTGNITFKVTDAEENTYTKTNAVSALSFTAGTYNTASYSLKAVDEEEELPIINTETADYVTGFESSDGYTASTTYNNTEVVLFGADGSKWGTYYGTVSTNNYLNGGQSMQMRWYTSAEDKIGYTETNFYLSKVGSVTFTAASTNNLKLALLYKGINDSDWTQVKTFALSTNKTTFEYDFEQPLEKVQLRFMIVLPESQPSNTSNVRIDDVIVSKTIPTYTISINTTGEGSVIADKTTAAFGETVALTITPEEDYSLSSISIIDANNTVITLNEDNTFIMPSSNVTVSAVFVPISASGEWTLVSSLENLTEGTYTIAAFNSSKYYAVPSSTIAAQTFTCIEGTFYSASNTFAPKDGSGEFVFTPVAGENNSFYIYNTELEKYLVATGSKKFGYVDNTSSDYGYWTFSDVASGGFSGQFSVTHDDKTHYMRAYNNSVRCYDGTSNNGIYLFKK